MSIESIIRKENRETNIKSEGDPGKIKDDTERIIS